MTDFSKYQLIYCSTCGKTQPMITDEMSADHLNDMHAMDLMCSECHLVIATLHADADTRPDRASS